MPRRHERSNPNGLTRRQWMTALGVGGAAALAGCIGDDDDDDDDDETETNIGPRPLADTPVEGFPDRADSYDTNTSASFETLNPIYNTEAGAGTAIGRTLDQGYTFDENDEVFPLLYDLSTDQGEVWVFDLRDNLRFSDPYGQVTADDFVYYIQEVHQSETFPSANSDDWNGVNVTETGNLQFQAELDDPQLLWPETFAPLEYPIPRGLIEGYVEDEDVDGMRQDDELLELQFTGNLGPYVLDEWTRGDGTRYDRNDEYYLRDIDEGPELFEQAPYFDGARIEVVEEQASRLAQLETGEVDNAAIPPDRFQEFADNPDVNVVQQQQPFNEVASLNMRDNGWTGGPGNLFQFKEMRQAIAAAVDKGELIEGVLRGLGDPHITWQPEWSPWYPPDERIEDFAYGTGDLADEDLAQDLMEDAIDRSEFDYALDGGDLVTPDGDQVVLEAYHSSGQETEALTTEFVADAMEEVLGIEVNVNPIDGTRFSEDFWQAEPEGGVDDVPGQGEVEWAVPTPQNPGPRDVTSDEEWDISLVFGLNTYPRNPLTTEVFFDGANSFYNPVGYYPEEFDPTELYTQAREADDRDELTEAMHELFTNLAREQPYLMLYFDDDLSGYNPDLIGPIEDFSSGWDFAGWHLE